MNYFDDLAICNKIEFEEDILTNIRIAEDFGYQHPIMVVCNNVSKIIHSALEACKKAKKYEVYYQPNSDFYWNMEIGEICTREYYKKKFEDYCNYFDYYRETLISRININLYNYSKKEPEMIELKDYPVNKKMILIVENFNFWDLNSQSYLIQLSNNSPNILLIGQLRSDFDFAIDHIDIHARIGQGYCTSMKLEE